MRIGGMNDTEPIRRRSTEDGARDRSGVIDA
jgi:hypothetical protein